MPAAPRCRTSALLESLLVGLDPNDTDRVFDICQSVDFHHGRNWTVEVAVWDLLARAGGQAAVATAGREPPTATAPMRRPGSGSNRRVRVERLLAWQEQGVRAAKLRFNHSDWREDVKVVEAAREAVGSGMELMVDANQGWRMAGDLSRRWDLATAQDCARALGELGVFWLEEPLRHSRHRGICRPQGEQSGTDRGRGDGALVVRDPAPASMRST